MSPSVFEDLPLLHLLTNSHKKIKIKAKTFQFSHGKNISGRIFKKGFCRPNQGESADFLISLQKQK